MTDISAGVRSAALLAVGLVVGLAACSGPSRVGVATTAAASTASSASTASAASAVWTIAPVQSLVERSCSFAAAGSNVVCSADGKTAYQLGKGLTGHIVETALLKQGAAAAPNENVIDFKLVASAKAPFAQITRAAFDVWPQHGFIAIVLDGQVVCAVQVGGPITDGHFVLAGLTRAQSLAVAAGRLPSQ